MQAKPTIIPRGEEHEVTFPCGTRWRIFQSDRYEWRAYAQDREDLRDVISCSFEHAYRGAWAACYPAPAPLDDVTIFELRPLENADRSEYTKALKQLLKRRTGRTWSVTGGKGTAYSWISVTAPPARKVDYMMTAEDEAILSSVFDRRCGSQDHSIPPTGGYRLLALCQAAGIEATGVKLQDHAWD